MDNAIRSMPTGVFAVALFLLTTPFAHSAESTSSGFYATLFAGGNFSSDATFSGNIGDAPQSVENEYDNGFIVGGALGKEWGRLGQFGVRTEIELSYRENDVDNIFFSGNGPAAEVNVSGDSSSTSIFGNVLVDLPLSTLPLTPFAGVGLGIAFTEQDFVYGPGVRVGDSDEVFTGQLIAGVSYDVTDRIALTLDGRYQRAFSAESRRLAPNGTLTGTIDEDLDSISVALGLRLKFW